LPSCYPIVIQYCNNNFCWCDVDLTVLLVRKNTRTMRIFCCMMDSRRQQLQCSHILLLLEFLHMDWEQHSYLQLLVVRLIHCIP
jgi:hypothetical protein